MGEAAADLPCLGPSEHLARPLTVCHLRESADSARMGSARAGRGEGTVTQSLLAGAVEGWP